MCVCVCVCVKAKEPQGLPEGSKFSPKYLNSEWKAEASGDLWLLKLLPAFGLCSRRADNAGSARFRV